MYSTATVHYKDKRITGVPATEHPVVGKNIEILESENCEAKISNSQTIEVSEFCQFLHGMFRYIFIPNGKTVRHQIFIDFSVSKSGGKNHVFLINSPMEIDEKLVTTLSEIQ